MNPCYRTRLRCLFIGLLCCFAVPRGHAQAPAWQLAVAASSTNSNNFSAVNATAVDAAGNVYLAGQFSGTLSLGSTSFVSRGSFDVFVAKWSPVSGFVWVQQAGGTGADVARAVAVEGSSVYVAGAMDRPASFGPFTFTSYSAGGMFVAKLADGGTAASFVWAQQMGSANPDIITALVLSGGNIYITGFYKGYTATFGSITLSNPSYLYEDIFVAKLTDTGTGVRYVWAERAGSTDHDEATALAVRGTNVYLAGTFYGTSTSFGPFVLTGPSAFGSDVFVAKIVDAGSSASWVWATRAGGTGSEALEGLAADGPNLYLAGSFQSATASFGSTTLTSAGGRDAFVAKLVDGGSNPTFAWAQRAGGTGADYAYGIAVSAPNVYVTGFFDSPTAAFGSTSLTNTSTSTSGTDLFVARLTESGTSAAFAWAAQASGANSEIATEVVLNGRTVYVAGYLGASPTAFGPQTVGTTTGNVAFFATLTDAPVATAARPANALVGWQLYPNPAHGTATVQLPPMQGIATATLTILDALGRAIRSQPAATNASTELNLTGLAPGVYTIQVAAGGSTATRRLVVE